MIGNFINSLEDWEILIKLWLKSTKGIYGKSLQTA